jgi:hypothetical protein
MQFERDMLRDIVLPKVNAFASLYGRAVEIIDLRWGVDTANTTEAEQNNKVLRTCLDEIERSRPFFIGLIGDRYGWTPPKPDLQAALDASAFSPEDLDMSVTALEIEYGVLHAKNPPVSLFYFRDSPDYSSLPDEVRRVYQDSAAGLMKLSKLKKEILERFGSGVKKYAARIQDNNLTVSSDWAQMVAEDIISKLQDEWGEPSEAPPDWKERERDIQDGFRVSRTAYFAGRAAAVADLKAFCLGDGQPQLLMMQGEAGSGKSAIFCKVMEEIQNECLLLPFCCGISPRSSSVESMLRYFISILCEELEIADESGDITKFQDLKDFFIELISRVCEKKRVVAVVDALDQLNGSDEARKMLWISGSLPSGFRLLCSIIGGPEIEAFRQLGGAIKPVPAVSEEDEKAIIQGIAARHHKQIGSVVIEYILKKQTPDGRQAAQNPLYLSLITQDLVMMDRYELDIVQKYMAGGMSQPKALAAFMRERIDETPGDPEGAYLFILSRLEKLIGSSFVRSVAGLIAISRSGLCESDLDGAFKKLNLSFNPADFSWLRQMLREHMAQGDMQQWDFAHQSLRRALHKDRPDELKKLNDSLVSYFQDIIAKDYFAAREIMHHLCIAGKPGIAAGLITDFFYNYCTLFTQGLADVYTEHKEGPEFLLNIAA